MEIKNIELRGIRDLYAYYATLYREPNSKIYADGKRKVFLFDNLSISFEIGDISDMEYFALSLYTSGSCIPGSYKRRPNKLVDTGNVENVTDFDRNFNTWSRKIDSLKKQMSGDVHLIPAATDILDAPALFENTAIVEFTRVGILSLFHVINAFEMFKDWMGELIEVPKDRGLESYKFPPVEEVFDNPLGIRKPKLSFGDYAAQHFLNGFYTYYNELLSTVDLVSDSYVHRQCLNNLHSGEVRLLEILSPIVSIDMRGDQEFSRKLKIIKSMLTPDNNYVNEGTRASDILKLRISTKQSLKTFLHIVKHYPFEFIKNWEDIKIVLERTETISLPGLDNYSVRINSTYNMCYVLQQDMRETNRLLSLDYIPYGTPISFTMEASITDWERYIAETEQILVEENGEYLYDRDLEKSEKLSEESLVSYELWHMFHSVAQYIKAVSKTLE